MYVVLVADVTEGLRVLIFMLKATVSDFSHHQLHEKRADVTAESNPNKPPPACLSPSLLLSLPPSLLPSILPSLFLLLLSSLHLSLLASYPPAVPPSLTISFFISVTCESSVFKCSIVLSFSNSMQYCVQIHKYICITLCRSF